MICFSIKLPLQLRLLIYLFVSAALIYLVLEKDIFIETLYIVLSCLINLVCFSFVFREPKNSFGWVPCSQDTEPLKVFTMKFEILWPASQMFTTLKGFY